VGVAVTGVELAVVYVFAWAVRKARRVAGRADAEVDRALDAGMDRVHELVSRKLGADPELERLAEEAADGQEAPSALTRRRVERALTAAAEQDASFARELEAAVKAVEAAAKSAGPAVAGHYGLAVAGDVSATADHGSFAAGVANIEGGVRLGDPREPGPEKP
jgi:hypothetical protein